MILANSFSSEKSHFNDFSKISCDEAEYRGMLIYAFLNRINEKINIKSQIKMWFSRTQT